jgi:hypothetical protein
MQWNTVWNELCPVCGGNVPVGMPPLEVRATQAEYLHFRVCSPSCAAVGVRRPTQHFIIAERNQAARAASMAATPAKPADAPLVGRSWLGSSRPYAFWTKRARSANAGSPSDD